MEELFSIEYIQDQLTMTKNSYKFIINQKKAMEKFNKNIAGLMDQLVTNKAKQDLAEITQMNYGNMIKLEVELEKLQATIKTLEAIQKRLL